MARINQEDVMISRYEFNEENRKKEENHGILYLFGEINTGAAAAVTKEIIEINRKNELEFIQLLVNSSGGYTTDGFAIIDIMRWSRIPVFTTGIGMVASMGLLVFMAGAKGHRVITPRTSILSHRFSGVAWGSHSNLVAIRKEEDLMHKRIIDHYLEFSKFDSREDVEDHLLRESDVWLTAEEALSFGVADVVENNAAKFVAAV